MLKRYKRGLASSLNVMPRKFPGSLTSYSALLSAKRATLPPLVPNKSPEVPAATEPKETEKTKDILPVADEFIGAAVVTSTFIDSNHVDLELPDVPNLPDITDPAFHEILASTIEICNQMCDFTTATHDKSAKAKKLKALQQIRTITDLPDSITKLKPQQLDMLLDMCLKHIMRPRNDVAIKFLFSDDMVPLTEPSMEHLEHVYSIIISIYTHCPLIEHDNMGFLKRFIQCFASPDIKERTYLAQIVTIYANSNPDLKIAIRDRLGYMVMDYLEGASSPLICYPALMVIQSIVSSNPNDHTDFYTRILLPIVGAQHYSAIYQQMSQIIETFLTANKNLAFPTVKALMRHWPRTRSNKQAHLIKLLVLALSKVKPREFKDIRKSAFELIANSCTSTNAAVADASACVWRRLELEPYIIDSAATIFPIIYPKITRAISTHWNSSIIDTLNYSLEAMNRIDSYQYQEMTRSRTQSTLPEPKDVVRSWATVSRSAKLRDSELDLAQKLAEIQKVFVPLIAPHTSYPPLYMQSQAKSAQRNRQR